MSSDLPEWLKEKKIAQQQILRANRIPHHRRRIRPALYRLIPPHRAQSRSQRTSRYWRVRFNLGKTLRFVRSSRSVTQGAAREFARLYIRANHPQIFKLHF